jgi:hypothetical protein
MVCRNKTVVAILLSVGCLAGSLSAQTGIAPAKIERVGQSGWQFLKINGDARQAAMAGAFTAISQGDAGSVFGNPGSLADVRGYDAQVNVVKWVADIGYQSAAVAARLGDFGVVAASIAMLNYGEIPETANILTGSDGTIGTVTGNTYTAGDITAGVSYARNITDNLSVGGSLRWMRQTIAELSMNNWAVDIGTIYHTGFRSLRIAVTARNFGPDSRFSGWSEQYQTESDNVRLPLDFRAGIAMDFLDQPDSKHLLTVVVEGEHPNDGTEKIHLGASYCFNGIFTLRCGYKFNYDVQRFTLGGGISYPIGGSTATINYAYVDFGVLTQVHMVTVGFSFL